MTWSITPPVCCEFAPFSISQFLLATSMACSPCTSSPTPRRHEEDPGCRQSMQPSWSKGERRNPKMTTFSVLIRPVRREDASDLQTNCFSRNTLEEVQQQIESSLAGMANGQGVHLVAEVDGMVVGS